MDFKNYKIKRKTNLTDEEYIFSFDIIKNNIINLGLPVSEQDKTLWTSSLKSHLENPQFYFYHLYFKQQIVGFIELIKYDDYLFLSEIQLIDKVKQTRAILFILHYLFTCPEFKNEEVLYFTIQKVNDMSNKTFSHLGGRIVEEQEFKIRYKITRKQVEKYLNKFKITCNEN